MSNTILTVEEIQQLTEVQTQAQQIALELGNLEISKLQIEKRKEEVIAFLNEFKAKEQELGKSLSDKYGNGTIDLEKGEFIPTP
jgi:phosphopantetheine adenylyltransferase